MKASELTATVTITNARVNRFGVGCEIAVDNGPARRHFFRWKPVNVRGVVPWPRK